MSWPVFLGGGTGHGDSTEVLLGDGTGVHLGGGIGVFLGGGTGVFLGGGTGVLLGDGASHGVLPVGGCPLSMVILGPPVDASKKFGILKPRPSLGHGVVPVDLGISLNISVFLKSPLKYAKSAFNLSIMSVNGQDILWIVDYRVSKLDTVSGIPH